MAALAGVLLIALTVGQSLTALGLGFGLASAVSWAIGNVLVKRVGRVEMLGLMVWLSLIPPLPSLALSLAIDGPASLARAVPQLVGRACVRALPRAGGDGLRLRRLG
jgi:O-acetylserine/cysteine efflux transporter